MSKVEELYKAITVALVGYYPDTTPHRRVSTAEDGTITVDLAPKPVAPVWAFEGSGYIDASKPDDWERENQAAMIEAVKPRGKE